jgi:quercetin dioxygenase-like cupin family protein
MRDDIFLPLELRHGLLHDAAGAFPSRLTAWDNTTLQLPNHGTHFGFVLTGVAQLTTAQGTFTLNEGMYFAVPTGCKIGGGSSGIVVTSLNYNGVFMVGGPVEASGRLRYIDGCTDSLLIQPQISGDPCLNALYFPSHVSQTEHTHPSIRIGLIVSGEGTCKTANTTHSLYPGLAFVIGENGPHCFQTTDQAMVVIAYHPDSDFGPTHAVHPMINRTIIEGVSASQLSKDTRE